MKIIFVISALFCVTLAWGQSYSDAVADQQSCDEMGDLAVSSVNAEPSDKDEIIQEIKKQGGVFSSNTVFKSLAITFQKIELGSITNNRDIYMTAWAACMDDKKSKHK